MIKKRECVPESEYTNCIVGMTDDVGFSSGLEVTDDPNDRMALVFKYCPFCGKENCKIEKGEK